MLGVIWNGWTMSGWHLDSRSTSCTDKLCDFVNAHVNDN